MEDDLPGVNRQTDRRGEKAEARKRIAALVLAAGASSRMGSLKPLLRIGGSRLVELAVIGFLRAGFPDVRVVVGYKAREIAPILDRLGVRHIFNPSHEEGMFSSVLAGVRSLDTDTEAFFVLPADVPLVRPETIAELHRAYRESAAGTADASIASPRIVYPRFRGRRGHPPLIPTNYVAEDLPANFPGGLRALLRAREQDALDVDVEDEAVLMDCDTQEDFLMLRDYYSRRLDPPGAAASDSNNPF